MRRFVIIFLLIGALVAPMPTSYSYAQQQQRSKSSKKTKSSASLASQRGADLITAKQLQDYLTFVASDEMEGRDTPSRGLDTTAKFIGMNLSRWGIKPAGDDGTYYQRINLRRDRVDVSQSSVEIDGQTFRAGDDFIAVSPNANVSGQLVYAGHGWLIKSKNIDAYQGLNVKDKIIVINNSGNLGLPRGIAPTDLTGKRGVDWADPGEYARASGAKAIIAIPNIEFLSTWDRTRQRFMERGNLLVEKLARSNSEAALPRLIVSLRMAAALLQGEKQNVGAVFNGASSGELVPSFELNTNKNVKINIVTKTEMMMTQNVVGVLEGSDPVLKNEYVAVGAHYDHIGIGAPVNGDAIYNGADDDGSGTVAVLSMAEALAQTSPRPKRSILFVWHCGEEKGLWGSEYFTQFPTVPLNQVITQLNIDMIGRSRAEGDTNPANRELSGPNEIYVIGSKMMSTELGDLSERVNQSYMNLSFNYRYDDPADPNRFFFRSDHFNYAQRGIPIIFYFDGVHQDYHRPSDHADKIDYQKMERVARTIYMTLWEVANLATRPKIDKQLPQELIRRN